MTRVADSAAGARLACLVKKTFAGGLADNDYCSDDDSVEDDERALYRKKETRMVFDMIDKDRSGSIDIEELELLLLALGQPIPRDELSEAFMRLDQDGSGKLEYEEFFDWYCSL